MGSTPSDFAAASQLSLLVAAEMDQDGVDLVLDPDEEWKSRGRVWALPNGWRSLHLWLLWGYWS